MPAAAQAQASAEVPLSRLLFQLARDTRAEIIFDGPLVRGMTAKPVRKRLQPEAALRLLLAGTGIGYRVTPDGAFILYRLPAQAAAQQEIVGVSEILVIGRRSQNADVPRGENDVQSYKVISGRELRTAHRDNLDLYLRSRFPGNADIISPGQDFITTPGAPQSRVDIRGIGARQTLVLVDGRRMPSLPSSTNDFEQADLNGIPIGAIERVEILTSTSGGIHGPGAVGGVVNIIMRRDHEARELSVTGGMSTRGDAERVRVEARAGFSANDGATTAFIHGGYSEGRSLDFGQRDIILRARQVASGNDPAGYLFPSGTLNILPPSGAVFVVSADGSPLGLDAQNGGVSLGSSFTFLPTDFVGTPAERLAALIANAGKYPVSLSPGHAGAKRTLLNRTRVSSLLGTARHRFDSDVEIFLDGIYYLNKGKGSAPANSSAFATLASAPSNPFDRAVYFGFPLDKEGSSKVDISSWRAIGGVIVPLPGRWRAEAEYALGRSRYRLSQQYPSLLNIPFLTAIMTGLPGGNGLQPLAPLDDWTRFENALDGYATTSTTGLDMRNRFRHASLRLGGPIARLAGGPLALTLLAEERRETIAPSKVVLGGLLPIDLWTPHRDEIAAHELADGLLPIDLWTPHRGTRVQSAYGEIRAPLVATDSPFFPLSGLELQLATRVDRQRAIFPIIVNPFERDNPLMSLKRDAFMFTAGARTFPLPSVMLRGSYATGTLTPDFNRFQEREQVIGGVTASTPDPQRGGRFLGSEGSYTQYFGGSHDVRQARGDTISVGVVINPDGGRAPRISVDYSRIRTRGEIVDFTLGKAQLLQSEAHYPDRVVRASLTDADRALGFTGGRITAIDLRVGNSGRKSAHAVDFQFDWSVGTIFGGKLSPYARATWQPSIKTRSAPGEPWIERIGFVDGPLAWRGSAGMAWESGDTALDFNLQYYHRYRVTEARGTDADNERLIAFNGRSHVPAQMFLDISASHNLHFDSGPFRSIEARAGLLNIFDRRPAYVADPGGIGYSPYGDPRRRRFEISFAARL